MSIVGMFFGGCRGCSSAVAPEQIAIYLIVGAVALIAGILVSRSKRK